MTSLGCEDTFCRDYLRVYYQVGYTERIFVGDAIAIAINV